MPVMTKDSEHLFAGILLRWSALTQSEKVVGAGIFLIPLWWLLGWKYLLILLPISLGICEVRKHGELRLRRPSLPVVAAIAFGCYIILSRYFYGQYTNQPINPNSVLSQTNTWIGFGLILWYVQSKNIRVRLRVVAWSFSIVVVLMLGLWIVIYFGLRQADYIPPRSLFGILTGKGEEFVPGMGNSNFLMPYFPTDESLPGLVRYVYFFPGPEALALVTSFVCLLALELKNRLWSLLLFVGSFFLLLTSGTRACWVSLPLVICIRYFLIVGKTFGPAFICGLIAIVSFVSLSLPPVTNLVLTKVSNTAEATGNARADSTQVRSEIYRRTWKAIQEDSNALFVFGHVETGEGVLPGYAPAVVGSHSFIQGTLLYRSGVLGTGIFLTYWVSLIFWLYKTRAGRPLACLVVFIIFSITFISMELEMPVMPITLVCAVVRKLPGQLPTRVQYREVSYLTEEY